MGVNTEPVHRKGLETVGGGAIVAALAAYGLWMLNESKPLPVVTHSDGQGGKPADTNPGAGDLDLKATATVGAWRRESLTPDRRWLTPAHRPIGSLTPEFGGVDYTKPTATMTPTGEWKVTATPDTGKVELAPIQNHAFVCASPEYCLGGQMELVDGKRMYADMLDAFAQSKANNSKDNNFMKDLLGISNPTGMDLQNWLDKHGGRLPTKSPKGFKLQIPVNSGPGGGPRVMEAAQKYFGDSFYPDSRIVLYTKQQWEKNTNGVRDYVNDLQGQEALSHGYIKEGARPQVYGFAKGHDGHLVWVGGNEFTPRFSDQYPVYFDESAGGASNPDYPRGATAQYKTWLYVLRELPVTDLVPTPQFPGERFINSSFPCITTSSNSRDASHNCNGKYWQDIPLDQAYFRISPGASLTGR